MSGYGFITLLSKVSSLIIKEKILETFSSLPEEKRKSITYDNGAEFGIIDKDLEVKLSIEVYRANPYHSWERGSNENFNGLIRRYFPKGTDFAKLTQTDIDLVCNKLNHRPRKRLNYLTPHQVFVLGLKP